jgi:hypothetical protein
VESIDGRAIEAMVDRSLSLLVRTYHVSVDHGGGWYHRLDNPNPGPSATASGMASFRVHGRTFEHEGSCLRFLRHRQISSSDPRLDGGWAVNTSFGRPVTEATGLVTRLLVRSGMSLAAEGPDVRRAKEWLHANQNADGGWGPLVGQDSRVWLTAMATRAVISVDPRSPAIANAVAWLLNARDPLTGAWGEVPGHPATVTHTAYTLTALVETGMANSNRATNEAINAAYDWIAQAFDPAIVHDDQARMESYNVVAAGADGSEVTWQNAIWHPGLPFAVSALVRQPRAVRFDLIAAALHTMRTAHSAEGRWPSSDSSAALSVWSVAPFLDALADVRSHLPVGAGLVLTPLSPHAAVIQGGSELDVAPSRLLTGLRRERLRRIVRRCWPAGTLVLLIALGAGLLSSGAVGPRELGFGLLLPVVLLVLQLAIGRSGGQQPGNG